MSIIPPLDPTPKPMPRKDAIGRPQEVCRNCGGRIIFSVKTGSQWLHPDRGYTKYCTEPLVAVPENQRS